ncbi:MAG: DHHA1 domain-containing protein [Methanomassiliicoccaceae archaeon]|nr:DHHA1 domain-containing protein [Methanomassiliicoccaceae archaeon]
MSIRIYEQDAYVFEFEAAVTVTNGEWIALDITAFYPGGGGQTNDLGRICGLDVTDVKNDGDEILHKVPGHSLNVGDKVWCSVDWERRYDMMMGHTAEHLLFGGLKQEVPELRIVKIFISPESKYVIVDRDIDWDVIERAQRFVNDAIADNLCVTKATMSRAELETEGVRAKTERIDGDLVTVVEIGNADTAACSGMHVREAGEIGALIVDRKVSAGKDGHAIHFRVSGDAIARSMELSNRCLQITEILGAKTEDIVRAVSNARHDLETKTKQLRSAMKRLLSGMLPEMMDGVPVSSGIFETDDKIAITDAAEAMKSRGGVAVLLASSDTLSVIISSGTKRVDCSAVLRDAMEKNGGRGGGKADFAQGGVPDTGKAGAVLDHIMQRVRDALKQEV